MLGEISVDAVEWSRNPQWSEKYKNINFKPPLSVAKVAEEGLELRKKFGRGGLSPQEASEQGVGSGVTRAVTLKNQQNVSPETINRMISFFARHEGNLPKKPDKNNPTAAEIAWKLWGGDEGRIWALKVKKQMKDTEVENFSEEVNNFPNYPLKKKTPREVVLLDLIKLGIVKNKNQEEKLYGLDDENFNKVCQVAFTRYNEKQLLKDLEPTQKKAVVGVTKKLEGVEKLKLTASLIQLYNNSLVAKGQRGQSLYPPDVAQKYLDYLNTGGTFVDRLEVSDEEVDRVWESLDSKTRKALGRKGKPPKGVSKKGRGKIILKRLIEIRFRDEITGQPYTWRDIQPDHIKPVILFDSEEVGESEDPENLIFVHKGFNSLKGNFEREALTKKLNFAEFSEFVKTSLVKEYSEQASLTLEGYEKRFRDRRDQHSALREREKQILQNSLLWDLNTWTREILAADCTTLRTLMRSIRQKVKNIEGLTIPIRFINTSQARGGNFEYSAVPVNRVALLLNLEIPRNQWPTGTLEKALDQIKVEILNAKRRNRVDGLTNYDKKYVERFTTFVGEEKVPPEITNLFKKLVG